MGMRHEAIDIGAARRWCILRTSPGRTLAVADWLNDLDVEAWTPRRTFKRVKPGRCNLIDGKPPTVEIDAPILPTFVFARHHAAVRLVILASDTDPVRPAFSVFTHRGRIPLVGDRDVAGLRQAEAEAEAAIQAQREAETRQERRRLRAAAAKTERERRAALRAEVRHFPKGASVKVNDVDALAGMTGIVESSDGTSAMVSFGAWLTMKVEAWQLVDDAVQHACSVMAAE